MKEQFDIDTEIHIIGNCKVEGEEIRNVKALAWADGETVGKECLFAHNQLDRDKEYLILVIETKN